MQEKPAAPKVYTFRLSRPSMVVGLLGLVAVVVGFVAPAQATPPDPAHKDYVCKYVGKPGVDERLQTGQNPIWVDTAATEGTWFNDRQGRSYVLIADTLKLDPEPDVSQCPPPTPPPTTSTTSSSSSSSSSSSTSGTGTHTTPPTSTTSHTETHTTPPTSTTSGTGTSTETSSTTTSSTTSSTTSTTSTETPSTGATSPTSSTSAPGPETPATETPSTEAPEVPATEAPTTPAAPGAEQPELGAVNENAVPQAATDGADLMGGDSTWSGPRYGLVGSGALLLLAAGLMSMRRRHTF